MTTQVRNLVDTAHGYVNRKIFSDKELYQQELEQVFGRCWLFIGHETMVPKPNDFMANYMGEDPILLVRDAKGKLHSFLNMCRHRGNRICRADLGNAPSFMCTYHGWTFATDGKLVGVPGYKEAYFEELDRSQWGLVEAGQIGTYKELIFATWDKSAPSLRDYIGDAAYYLDFLVDRREGGAMAVAGVHRQVLNANWKFGADNFCGDTYHVATTHGSAISAGVTGTYRRMGFNPNPDRVSSAPGNGHGIISAYIGSDPKSAPLSGWRPQMAEYYEQHYPELEKRLGVQKAKQGGVNVATMFPNFTWHSAPLVRLWHPRGPEKMELWTWSIVDKAAPEEIKEIIHRNLTLSFGPAGGFEQDDMNNWIQCTSSAHSRNSQRYVIHQAMGLGHERKSELAPGVLSGSTSETNQRAFYDRWAEMMDAPSWANVKISPRTMS